MRKKLKKFRDKATPEAKMVISQIKACDKRESEIKIAVKGFISLIFLSISILSAFK